jgi:hypothetical protein
VSNSSFATGFVALVIWHWLPSFHWTSVSRFSYSN